MEQIQNFIQAFGFSAKETLVIVVGGMVAVFFWKQLREMKRSLELSITDLSKDLKDDITTLRPTRRALSRSATLSPRYKRF